MVLGKSGWDECDSAYMFTVMTEFAFHRTDFYITAQVFTTKRKEPILNIRDLVKYDFRQSMIDCWIEEGVEILQPIQAKAIQRHGLFEGNNLVISAPTSSGKTFIGELAAAHNALHGRKSIYLVPAKALAEEKFLSFKDFYGDFGLDIVISTKDRKEYDDALFNGDFDIAIIVFEKFFQLLNSAEAVISKISLVVVDELQLIADVNRGANLELLLTKLKLVKNDIQFIGLSAVIGNSRMLPEWLVADLLLEHRRQVELRMGYLSEGIYHYQTFNDNEQGTEEFIPSLKSKDKRETMVAVAGYLAGCGEQSLVFLPDKDSTRRLAVRLYDETDLSPAQKAMEELKLLEETNSRDALLEVLEGGIAFHNADLSAEERSIVEKYFRQGEIRILTSTTTLAMGVNLNLYMV